MRPPPNVPYVRIAWSTTINAPGACGAEPCVATTAHSATDRPARTSSTIRSNNGRPRITVSYSSVAPNRDRERLSI